MTKVKTRTGPAINPTALRKIARDALTKEQEEENRAKAEQAEVANREDDERLDKIIKEFPEQARSAASEGLFQVTIRGAYALSITDYFIKQAREYFETQGYSFKVHQEFYDGTEYLRLSVGWKGKK